MDPSLQNLLETDDVLISPEWFHCAMRIVGKFMAESPRVSLFMNVLLKNRFKLKLREVIVAVIAESYDCFSQGSNDSDIFCHLKYLHWHSAFRSEIESGLKEIIEKEVLSACDADFDEKVLDSVKKWLSNDLLVFAGDMNDVLDFNALELFCVTAFVNHRSKKLFEMITDFPDSMLAVIELKEAISVANNVGQVGLILTKILERRLLHMGAATSQILDFYITMIKALRIIDPSDLLLSYVAIPVRKYLRSRSDTVRCIVSSLTSSKDSELYNELRQGGSLEYGIDEDDEDSGPGERWEPRKRNHEFTLIDRLLAQDGSRTKINSRGIDILALLVSMYGSTDLFIVEYRALLSDKMLSSRSYATDQEVANLELLKIRFGDEPLHSCEVMLKDIEDSKRINSSVHHEQRLRGEAALGAAAADFLIVSENYWPAISQESLVYHPQITQLLEAYEGTYHSLKKPRRIHPVKQLGSVDLELDFEDGSSRTFTVSPAQATVIAHFGSAAGPVGLSQLSMAMQVEEEEVLALLNYWIHKGVVCERAEGSAEDRYFAVVEEQASTSFMENSMSADFQNDMNMRISASAEAQQKILLENVGKFTMGLLTGQGAMTLDRIYEMLKLSGEIRSNNSSLGLDMNVIQLRTFLQSLIDRGNIEFLDSKYSICKK